MKTLLAMHLVVPDFSGGMTSPEIETGLLAVIPSTSHGNGSHGVGLGLLLHRFTLTLSSYQNDAVLNCS